MIRPKYSQAQKRMSRADELDAREIVTLRDRGVCVKCLRRHTVFGISYDHRKNRSQGGDWSASNGQLLCGDGTTGCHGWVTEHPKEAVDEGWAVPGWSAADPREWPARRWLSAPHGTLRLGWVIYDDDGGVLEISEQEAHERMKSMGWVA